MKDQVMFSKRTKSTAASLIASKRIAVAICAAVAMVLGAMSVGATMHTYPTSTTPTNAPQPQAPPHANTTALPEDTPVPVTPAPPKPITQPKIQTQKVIKPLLLESKDDDEEEHQSLLQLQVSPSQASLGVGSLLDITATKGENTIQTPLAPVLQPVTNTVNTITRNAGMLTTPPATTPPPTGSSTASSPTTTPTPTVNTTTIPPSTNTPAN